MPKEAATLTNKDMRNHRRDFQVPLTETEKAFLLEAKAEAGVASLAGFMRDAAIALAEKRLRRGFPRDE